MSGNEPRRGRRVHKMPDAGHVVVAHPSAEWAAQRVAVEHDLPYLLHKRCPSLRTHAYVLDAARDRSLILA